MTSTPALRPAILALALAFGPTTAFADEERLQQVWETQGFSMPESVVTIPNHNWIYVSNVNQDQPGYISRLAKDGTLENLKWVDGLDSPTGLATYDGDLYVVDQTSVLQISTQNGEIVQSYTAENAIMLNDIAISDEGQVFVGDIAGGTIFTVEGDALVPWLDSAEHPFPNGLFVQGDSLIVANWGARLALDLQPNEFGYMYEIDIAEKSIERFMGAESAGSVDGITSLGDSIIVSQPLENKLVLLSEGGEEIIGMIENGPADIGNDETDGRIYVPLLTGNSLVAYSLAPADH